MPSRVKASRFNVKHNCIGAEQRSQIRDDFASVFATYFYRTFGDGHVINSLHSTLALQL